MHARTLSIALSVVAFFTAALLWAEGGKKPVNWQGLPAPFASPSASNRPQVVARPDGAELNLPKGFAIEEYDSGDYIRPRYMLLGPSNEVLLSDSGDRNEKNGAVFVLENGSKQKIIEGLDRPFGMQLHKDWLYVAETTSIKRYKYDKAAKKVSSNGEEVFSMAGFDKGHWTRSILFNDDHSKLFVTVGSGSNVDAGEPKERAALHGMNPDGSDPQIFAEGLRNVIGLRFEPTTNKIWGAIQERDGLGDNLVSDYLVQIQKGGFYGWPYAYTGPNEDPRRKGEEPELVKNTLYPDVMLGAHVAVLDMQFYTANQFPEKYRGGLFLAFHGSWNRAERTGYKIAFIPFENGRPLSGPQDFLTGWMTDPETRQVWGRPVGLLVLPDGSMLVTDDGGKKIWRISYKG